MPRINITVLGFLVGSWHLPVGWMKLNMELGWLS